MSKPALCQCLLCHKYMSRDRDGFADLCTRPKHAEGPCNGYPRSNCPGHLTWRISEAKHECCETCVDGGIPLAKIRGTLVDPKDLELLALLSEECAEVVQRVSKIIRWGWSADFHGSTQYDKLCSELGDVQAIVELLDHNKIVKYQDIMHKMEEKLDKLKDDAGGPRQRLLHAEVP